MSQVSNILLKTESGFAFWCPGCQDMHVIPVTGARAWGFNGDVDRPTFHPSIRVRCKLTEKDEAGRWTGEWVRDEQGNPVDSVCHSFVENGQIRYLEDCTHALAGKTVGLPAIPDWDIAVSE